MENIELCRRVFASFKELCAQGRQPSSFFTYCKTYGISASEVRNALKGEYCMKSIPGEGCMALVYSGIYEDFKCLCENGQQPGSYSQYCRDRGVSHVRMQYYMKDKSLKVSNLPGFKRMMVERGSKRRCQEVPFEDVIFEEAGFFPADCANVITVKVDRRVAVSFPADTDVATVAKFVRKIRKEVGNVGA